MAALALFVGAQTLRGISQFEQAKQQQKLDEQQNDNARIASEDKNAAVSANIMKARESYTKSVANADINEMQARSEAIVSAAAAGTAGLSVDDTIFDIERNASRAEAAARDNLSTTIINLERSRKGIEAEYLSRLIPANKPDALAIALGLGVETALATKGSTWDF